MNLASKASRSSNDSGSGRPARIITVANQKGGVGKTTSVMNLGVALARMGRRVLLVDSDPQANLTSYLGVRPGEGTASATRTLDEMYLARRTPSNPEEARASVVATAAGVDLIPCDRALSGVEYYLFSRPEKEMVLARFLSLLVDDYDVILVDTPPSMNLLTLNALCASHGVLIPVQPEFFGLEGIVKVRQTIAEVKAGWNPELEIIGVLPTQVAPRRSLTQEVLQALKEEIGDVLFEARIHEAAAVTESSGHALSVFDYDRKSRGAKDYLEAARELASRIG
jgi:chromosome partitioning protein